MSVTLIHTNPNDASADELSAKTRGPVADTSWHEAYLEAYRKCRTNAGAARAAGVTVDVAKGHVRRCPELAAQIAEINKQPMPSLWHSEPALAENNGAEPNGTDWAPRYFEALRLCGSPRTAARIADIPYSKIQKRSKTDQRFVENVDEAKEGHLDDLEADLTTLGRKGNVIAAIARLRAGRPEKYLEKAQIQQVIAVNTRPEPSPEDIQALLRDMLASARPETLKALAAAKPDSLPAPADSQ